MKSHSSSTHQALIILFLCLTWLSSSAMAHQSAFIAPTANSPDSINVKPLIGSSQLSCSVSAYSNFQDHQEASFNDVALKFLKKVEVVWSYHQDPQLSAAQMALKRSNPIAKTSILISFKMPHAIRSQAKLMPNLLKDTTERLIAPYVGASSALEWANQADKCAWVDSRSFFDNTVALFCAFDEVKFNMDATSGSWKREWIPSDGSQESPKRVIERLILSKSSDSATLWNYDPATYVYDPSDTKHPTIWNVTRELDSWLPVGRYEMSPSPSKDSSSSLQVSSTTIPLALKLLSSTTQRSLTKSGMHRELVTTVSHKRISPPTGRISCRIVSIELLPDSVFVDQYEVEENARFGGPSTTIYRDIDLEKPSFLSSQNIILLSSPVPWDSTNSTLSLPIHFRYQMPNPSNPYSDILINPSIMLTLCSQTSRPPSPPDTSIVVSLLMGFIPTLPQGHSLYLHRSPSAMAPIQTPWPVGKWSEQETVSTITFAVTLIMSVSTIIAVWYQASKK